MICKFGICVDSGEISQCDLNSSCLFFTAEDKQNFDNLPDLYFVRSRNGDLLGFKNRNQLNFYLNDFGGNEVLMIK